MSEEDTLEADAHESETELSDAVRPGWSPGRPPGDQVIIAGAQLILAEKRTALAVMRTGIAVLALPLGVLSLLVATSGYYTFSEALPLFVPLLLLCAGLVALGVFLVFRSVRRIRACDAGIRKLRGEHSMLGRFLDR